MVGHLLVEVSSRDPHSPAANRLVGARLCCNRSTSQAAVRIKAGALRVHWCRAKGILVILLSVPRTSGFSPFLTEAALDPAWRSRWLGQDKATMAPTIGNLLAGQHAGVVTNPWQQGVAAQWRRWCVVLRIVGRWLERHPQNDLLAIADPPLYPTGVCWWPCAGFRRR